VFGGANVGNTQYVDAFQRANFWHALDDRNSYHVLLNPITTVAPFVLDVPEEDGTTIPPTAFSRPLCGREALVDIFLV
jgi:hypothetical protein